MRLLQTLTALVLAVSTVTVAPQIADACGGSYGAIDIAPTVHLVSVHRTENASRRAFIGLAPSDEDRRGAWTRLWPSSFDYTAVRELEERGTGTFTLVGPSGRRVVKPTRRVLVNGSVTFGHDTTQRAAEVGVKKSDDFTIAIAGERKDATWFDLEAVGFSARPTFAERPQFELRRGETTWGTYDGHALGAVQTGGRTYLIVKQDATALAYWIL